MNKSVLPQNGVFNNIIVNCQLSDRVKYTVNSLPIMKFLTSTVIYMGEKLTWTITILLECLHILKMYAWSLSGLQSKMQISWINAEAIPFQKKWLCCSDTLNLWWLLELVFLTIEKYSNNSHAYIKKEHFDILDFIQMACVNSLMWSQK